jgi:hypothetical protein
MSKALLTKVVMYPDRVEKRVAKKTSRVLFKLGAFLRTAMQRSMRYSNKPSAPRRPPHAHKKTGAQLRKRIRFNVDLKAGSVICGPDLKPDSSVQSLKPLPAVLNNGGVLTATLAGERITTYIAPRPFTAPAFTDGGRKFLQLLSGEKL